MNWRKWLILIGLVLFFTGLVATGLAGRFNVITGVLSVVGLAMASVLFFPRADKNGRLYLNMGLYSLFFLSSLVMFFLILQRHPAGYDSTAQKLYSISAETRNFLTRRLAEPIRITGFLTEADRDSAAMLLDQYSRYSPHISYELHNPYRDIAATRRFGFAVQPGDVFVERLTSDTKTAAKQVKVQKVTEEEVTNAIVQSLRLNDVTIYFLAGHGELPLEKHEGTAVLTGRKVNEDNLSALAQQLERSYMRALPLNLAQRGRVPGDASVVVVARPQRDLTPSEMEALRSYLAEGGRGIFLMNPEGIGVGASQRRFADLLEMFGVSTPADVVTLPYEAQQGGDPYTIPVQVKKHAVTAIETGEALLFNQARPVLISRSHPEGAFMEPLLVSPEKALRIPIEEYARMLLSSNRELQVKAKPSDLSAQPLGLAVTVQPVGQSQDRATKIVVIGNGSFVSTERITQTGWLLFQNSINWLTNAGDLIAIPSKQIENTPVTLSAWQKQLIFLFIVIIVPVFIGLGGLAYSASRRQLQ